MIIVASILFSRGMAFAIAAACSLTLLGGMTVAGLRGKIPTTFSSVYTRREPALLVSEQFVRLLRDRLSGQPAGAVAAAQGLELEEKREELLDLQDFTEDIIHSMRGGLITTDMAWARSCLLNRTGEEILGYRFADIRGRKLSRDQRSVLAAGHAGR